jgi:hypothetical protein
VFIIYGISSWCVNLLLEAVNEDRSVEEKEWKKFGVFVFVTFDISSWCVNLLLEDVHEWVYPKAWEELFSFCNGEYIKASKGHNPCRKNQKLVMLVSFGNNLFVT